MSEGWSDFFAISFLSQPGDNLNGQWRIGRWLFFPGGIRREPYSMNQTVFTRTYADIVDGAFCTKAVCSNDPTMICTKNEDCGMGNTCVTLGCSFDSDCEPPNTTISQGPRIAEVHNTGELWAETLWLARANLVRKYGFATGSQTIHQLVIDGMKLSPDNPTFLDMRDSILLADLVREARTSPSTRFPPCRFSSARARTSTSTCVAHRRPAAPRPPPSASPATTPTNRSST
jgi:hypothetical protein